MLLVDLSHQLVRSVEAPVELAGETLLDRLGSDGVPMGPIWPHEDDRHLTRPGVVQPDLLRDERNPALVQRGGLAERPDLVVDPQEFVDVAWADLEHQHFDRPTLVLDVPVGLLLC